MHNDIETKARYESVCSLIDGMMENIGCEKVYGKRIRHLYGSGVRSSYSHHSEAHVTRGCQVSSGQTIGISANKGRSFGPKPHFLVVFKFKQKDVL